MSWSMKEVIMRRTTQSNYRALTLSLSHRSFMVGLWHSPWYVCGLFIRCVYIFDRKEVLRITQRESLKILISRRVVDQLSPHHDSQFSAFSTEVFIQINQKHNRSSSLFTTLADKTERKVASTGARQPNYWPKTWFGADAYNAKFGVPNYTTKSV